MIRAAALLAVLVVLAGCGGTSAGGRTTTSPGTSTGAPVPTDAAWGAVAPSVDEGGVFDAVGLASSHRSVLEGESPRVRPTLEVTSPNGTVRRWDETVVFGPDRGRTHTVRRADGVARERWTNGTRRRTGPRGRLGEVPVGPSVDGLDRASVERACERSLPGLFASLERARVQRHGERAVPARYRPTARAGPLFGADTPLGLDPDGGTQAVLVDEWGFVPERVPVYEATTRDGRRVTVLERLEHLDVGASDVTRPSWATDDP